MPEPRQFPWLHNPFRPGPVSPVMIIIEVVVILGLFIGIAILLFGYQRIADFFTAHHGPRVYYWDQYQNTYHYLDFEYVREQNLWDLGLKITHSPANDSYRVTTTLEGTLFTADGEPVTSTHFKDEIELVVRMHKGWTVKLLLATSEKRMILAGQTRGPNPLQKQQQQKQQQK